MRIISGIPAVVTLTMRPDGLSDGRPLVEVLNQLHEDGAAVVGLNCGRGPSTMLPLLAEITSDCKVIKYPCNSLIL